MTTTTCITPSESSADAAIREAYEETGCHFAADRLACIEERFYKSNGRTHHQVVFYYLMKAAVFHIEDGSCTDQPAEKPHWLPLDALQDYNLVPAFLRTAL